MNKEKFALTIKLEHLHKEYSETLILDNFDTYKDCREWADWLEELYNKVKEKK